MKYQEHNGIYIPKSMKIKSWIVTGTPGSGKTYLIEKIHGVPGEICIDISMKKWWSVPPMAQRPREIHLSLPFVGLEDAHPVYGDMWSKTKPKKLPHVAVERIRIPKKKKFFFSPDWRARFVFDFILPPPQWNYDMRRKRLESGDEKLVDVGISKKLVAWQSATLWKVAWHFYLSGLHVLVRPFNVAYPYVFPDIVRILRKKPKKGGGSVFPKGVDMGTPMNVSDWLKQSAPPDWRKTVSKGKKISPKNV